MKKITPWLLVLLFYVQNLQSQVLFEDFEGASFPPTGWLVADNGVGTFNSWTRTNLSSQVYQGTWSAFMTRENIGSGNTAQDWLITPQILVPTNGQLKFFARTTLAGNQGTVYQVRVSTNANQAAQGNYALVQQFSENELSSIYDVYEEKVINLTAFVGQQVYIAFVMQFTQPTGLINGDRWLLDNVSVVQQCFAPTALTATNISQNSAQLQWGNPSGATQWEVEVVPQPGNPTGSGVIVNTNPYVTTGLQPATQYQYYVRAICQPNNNSPWAGPFSFQTAIPGNNCASAIQIPSLPYSTSGTTQGLTSTVTGTPGTSGTCGGVTGAYLSGPDIFYTYTATTSGAINVQMTPNGNFSGIFVYTSCANVGVSCVGGAANTGSTVRNFNFNAVAGQTYIIVISTTTAAPNVSYNLVIQQPGCLPPPTGLNATNVGQTSATLGWTINGSPPASAWEVAVQNAGDSVPSGNGTPVTSNSFVATQLLNGTPLQASSNYQFWVRTNCGNGNFSIWAGPFAFSTLICNPSEQCNYTFRMTSTASSGGWNGARMQIIQGGVIVNTIGATFNSGTQADVTVALCNNIPYQVVWSVAGTFPNNVGLSIINPTPFNQTIFTKPAGVGLPQTTIYNAMADCNNPACLAPSALATSNITINSASLSWTSNGFETQWEVLVLPNNAPAPGAGASGIITSNNPYQITGLNPATIYNVYVRAVCGTGVSAWSQVHVFNTLVCNAVDQCVYSFVLTDTGNNGWQGNTISVTQNNILIANLGPTFTTGGGPITIPVSLCPGVPFEVFWNAGGTNPAQIGLVINDPFNEIIYTKNPGQGAQNTMLYTGIGNCTPPACFQPQNINVSNVTNQGATIAWTQQGNPAAWEVYVVIQGQPAPSSTNFTTIGTITTSNPFTITGLNGGTVYQAYVRAICNSTNNTISIWNGPANFSTIVSNDECNQSILVPVNPNSVCTQTVPGSLVGATASNFVLGGTCAGVPNDDVWFHFTALNNQHYVNFLNIVGTPTGLSFAIYTDNGCTNPLGTPVFCASANQNLITNLIPGQTYKIRVFSTTNTPNASTTFDLCIRSVSSCSNAEQFCSVTGTTYLNSTGLPSLGQIGCLFTTPNPTYFYLNIQQSGVLNLTIQQTSLATGAGLDVDYVAWGPFTSQQAACAVIPANPLPDGDPPGGNALHGCSYSAAPIEYMNIPNAQAGEIYVVLITNFSNQPGTISFTQTPGIQNPAVSSFTPVFDPIPNNGNVCVGDVINLPSTSNNGIFGTWNETMPFTVSQNTQLVFTPNANQCSVNFTTNLTVSSALVDTLSDVNQCGYVLPNLTNGNYFTAPNGQGTPLAVGTVINTPQTIYIFNQIGNCSAQTSFNVTIPNVPVDTLSDVTVCSSFTLPSLTNGNYYSQSGGLGTMLSAGDVISSSQTIYIFNTINGCSGESQFNVTITSPTMPTFNSVANICPGASLSALPTTSLNGIVGTWSPALNNQATTTYTFTPDAGQCATTATLTITVLPNNITPTFTQVDAICAGGTLPALPTTSNNGIIGTWSPALNNQATTTYTFTPNSGQCAETTTMTITVNPNITPTFDAVAPICVGATLNALPTTSLNGITGTWSPGLNSSTTTTYTFTPTAGQCATTATLIIVVNQEPSFNVTQGCNGTAYELTVNDAPAGATYQWLNASNAVIGTESTVVVSTTGVYQVNVTSTDGCSSQESVAVTLINCTIQKGISPNGDGLNDNFDLTGFGVVKLTIYNRYGKEVYSKTNYVDEWFGQANNGAELPDGTYYYAVELVGETKTGWIYINRER
jgi:gliding motility-associated-like protein